MTTPYRAREFRFHDLMQRWDEVMLLGFPTVTALHVRTATALSGNHIAVVIQRTSRMTVAQRTSFRTIRQPISLRNTLVTITSSDKSLAGTLTRVHIAPGIIDRSQDVTHTRFASIGSILVKVPETVLTLIASSTIHVSLAVTRSSLDAILLIGNGITNAVIQRASRITIARFTHVRALDVFVRIPVEERSTYLAVMSLGVVLTVITHTTANATRQFVNRWIEVTACGVIVAVTFYKIEN